ncbi:hypothetical protein K4F52_003659 [Lecanicillium sp. MT-2017a]|nr:hypothetical protein K4F52_003659 [Lecanicillium sp. MT-2017a]
MSNDNTNTRRPSSFLSLAPDVSDSYPRVQTHIRDRNTSVASSTSTADSAASPTSDKGGAASRRSSDSSTGGSGSAKRVLKLGPVHWGEHTDDHKEDFYSVDSPVEETK